MIKLPALIELDGFIGNAPYNVRFTCTDSGYITPTIACSGADIYLDGVLAGSVDALGAELLANGDFSAWTTDNPDSWIVGESGDVTSNITQNPAGNCQIISDGTSAYIQQNILSVDSFYKLTVDCTAAASGTVKLGDGGGSRFFGTITSTGSLERHGRATSAGFFAARDGACDITIDNISIKLVGETSLYVTKGQTVDFVFSDPSSVTYIDMRGDSLQGDASQFGQFSNLDELYYPDMEYKGTLGDELLTNFDFANWTADDPDGWTVNGEAGANEVTENPSNQAQIITTGNFISIFQNILTVGSVYEYEVRFTAVASGSAKIQHGSTDLEIVTSPGIYSGTFFATSVTFSIGRASVGVANDFTIDYASVKQVTGQSDMQLLTNFDFATGDSTGWDEFSGAAAIVNNSFVLTANGVNRYWGQDFGLAGAVGGVYVIEYYVSQNSLAGDTDFTISGTSAFPSTTAAGDVGFHAYVLFAINAAPSYDFRCIVSAASTSGTITIDYFSIKAIASELVNGGFDDFTGDYPDDWGHSTNAGDGSSEITEVDPGEGYGGVGTGAVNIKSTGTLATIFQSTAMTVGSQYRTTYSATNVVSGVARCEFGGTNFTVSATGDFLHYNTATSAVYALARNAACDITFDNALVLPWPAQNIGNIASLITPTIEVLYIDAASNIAWTDGAFDNELAMTNITLDAVNLTVTEVNAFFASLTVANAAGAVNCTVTLLDMIAPTGQGDTDATALAADGWTVTVNGTAY